MRLDFALFARFAKKFKDGQIIFSEFELGDTFFLIQSGRVELIKLNGDMEKTIAILNPTEMFGEMAILEASPRSATAIARGECVVLEFNRENFNSLMERLPELAMQLLRLFITRMRDSKLQYLQAKRQDPLDKVAEVFVQLDSMSPGLVRTNGERVFNTNVEVIARLAGLSENEAQDVLNDLANKEKIEIHRGSILVKRMTYFKNYVEESAKFFRV
jgi:CRP-like cAMP-binding protein